MMNAAGARAGGGADGITGTTSSKQMGLAGEVARFSAQRERLLGFFFLAFPLERVAIYCIFPTVLINRCY
jgi:hypothetical protein